MEINHDFIPSIVWTGNLGQGTQSYSAYTRTWDISAEGVTPVHCSNDPRLGGDPTKLNPEDLLISALASCHMLWYLHFASEANIVVMGYEDKPIGRGQSLSNGSGNFIHATLRPKISVIEGTDLKKTEDIHHRIHEVCFIARSVNFPIKIETNFIVEPFNRFKKRTATQQECKIIKDLE